MFPNQFETSTRKKIASSKKAATFWQLPKRNNKHHLVSLSKFPVSQSLWYKPMDYKLWVCNLGRWYTNKNDYYV